MKRTITPAGRLSLLILIPLAVAGCGHGGSTSQGTIQLANPGPAVETVNGEEVPQRLLDALARSRNWDISRPELRERALKELTNYVLAAQAARKMKFGNDIDIEAMAEVSRLQAVSTATIAELQRTGPVDDEALRAEYAKQVGKGGGPDYDFTHIVFAKEADARKAAAEVAGGKPFDKVVEAHKKDALQTRSFTHVRAVQLPQPLSKAIEAMKPGETSKDPVQTPLGWHVLRLDNVTQHQPPAFEQVKDSLRRSLLKQSGDQQLQKLRADAKITLAEPAPATAAKPGPAPAPKAVPPPAAKPADDATKPKN